MMKKICRVPAVILVMSLFGCATDIPKNISLKPANDLSIEGVQSDLQSAGQDNVRWGGKIIEVNNFVEGSELVLLALPLNRWGQPEINSKTDGRFIATSDEFIDPAEYATDRLLTVYGQATGLEKRMIGDFIYNYPIVRIVEKHLWPKSEKIHSEWNWSAHDRWMNSERHSPIFIIRRDSPK